MTYACHMEGWDSARYPMLCNWWKGHGRDPVPLEMLPCYGALALDENDVPRVAAWFSLDPVNQIAHLDWLVSNPHNDIRKTRAYGLALLSFLADCAKEEGALWIFAQVAHPWLAKQAGQVGYVELQREQVMIGKRLG